MITKLFKSGMARYSQYEIKLDSHGQHLSISPVNISKEVFYDPDVVKILDDVIKIAAALPKKNYEDFDEQDLKSLGINVIYFVNKYGLLGLTYSMHPDYNKGFYNPMSYIKFAFHDSGPSTERLGGHLMQVDKIFDIEPLEMFVDAVRYIYAHSKAWDFYSNKCSPSDPYLPLPDDNLLTNFNNVQDMLKYNPTWSDRLSCFYNGNIHHSIEFNGKWEAVYRCNTLFDTICVGYMDTISQIRYCQNEKCGNPIDRSKPSTSKWCRDSCGNAYRQEKLRRSKK